jgi:hypothetical protein
MKNTYERDLAIKLCAIASSYEGVWYGQVADELDLPESPRVQQAVFLAVGALNDVLGRHNVSLPKTRPWHHAEAAQILREGFE